MPEVVTSFLQPSIDNICSTNSVLSLQHTSAGLAESQGHHRGFLASNRVIRMRSRLRSVAGIGLLCFLVPMLQSACELSPAPAITSQPSNTQPVPATLTPEPSLTPVSQPTLEPLPVPTRTPALQPTPTLRPIPTPQPVPTPTLTLKPTPTPQATPTPKPLPTPTPTPEPTPTPTSTPAPTPTPLPGSPAAVDGMPWISDGVNPQEVYAADALRAISSIDSEVAALLLSFPWVVASDISINELDSIGVMGEMMEDNPDLAKAVLEFEWVRDGVTKAELYGLVSVRDIATSDLELSMASCQITIHGDAVSGTGPVCSRSPRALGPHWPARGNSILRRRHGPRRR